MKKIRYPLRAIKISFEFLPFGFWWKPSFIDRRSYPEEYKKSGDIIFSFRWLQCQVVFSRWL